MKPPSTDVWVAAVRRLRGAAAMGARAAAACAPVLIEFIPGTDVDHLATALLSSLQGGLLLTKTLRNSGPLETALDAMIDHIGSFTNQEATAVEG